MATKKPRADEKNYSFGVCRVCLCTDQEACPEGCEWTDESHSLCSACEGLSESEEAARRAEAMIDLSMRLNDAVEELELLRHRFASVLTFAFCVLHFDP